MNFVKCSLIVMIAGTVAVTIIGVVNDDSIMQMFKTGKREVKKLRRRYSF